LLERLFVALVLERARLVTVLFAQDLLRSSDDADVMLGMLVVIFGRHRVAARMGVTGQLTVLLGNMLRRATDFHVRTV
jgi:hypothetical protein